MTTLRNAHWIVSSEVLLMTCLLWHPPHTRAEEIQRMPIKVMAQHYSDDVDTSLVTRDIYDLAQQKRWNQVVAIANRKLRAAGIDPLSNTIGRTVDRDSSWFDAHESGVCDVSYYLGSAYVALGEFDKAAPCLMRSAILMEEAERRFVDSAEVRNRSEEIAERETAIKEANTLLERQSIAYYVAEIRKEVKQAKQSHEFFKSLAGEAVIKERAYRLLLQCRDIAGYRQLTKNLSGVIAKDAGKDLSGLADDSLSMIAFTEGRMQDCKKSYLQFLPKLDPSVSFFGNKKPSAGFGDDVRILHTGICNPSVETDAAVINALVRNHFEGSAQEYPTLMPKLFSESIRGALDTPWDPQPQRRYCPQNFLDTVPYLAATSPNWSGACCGAVMTLKFQKGARLRGFSQAVHRSLGANDADLRTDPNARPTDAAGEFAMEGYFHKLREAGQLAGLCLLARPRAESVIANIETETVVNSFGKPYHHGVGSGVTENNPAYGGLTPWGIDNTSHFAPGFDNGRLWKMSELTERIKSNEAFLELAVTEALDIPNSANGLVWKEPRYVGWLLSHRQEPKFIDIGSRSEVERAVNSIRTAIAGAEKSVRTTGEEQAVVELNRAMRLIGERVFDPINAALQGVDKLTICPDASLWLIPWAAMPLKNGKLVVEVYEVDYADTSAWRLATRGVTNRKRNTPLSLGYEDDIDDGKSNRILARSSRSTAPLIVADADYDLTPSDLKRIEGDQLHLKNDIDYWIIPNTNGKSILPRAQRLPGTQNEGRVAAVELEKTFGKRPVVLQGKNALESLVRRTRNPEALVFSVHGFFLSSFRNQDGSRRGTGNGDQETSAAPAVEARGGAQPQGSVLVDWSENPLVRCGLLLSGANHLDRWGEVRSADGILTGLEAAMMDLRGTKLVVLSACDTGVGDATVGEGVAGLRQAFLMAGAQSVVASLWQVPDAATADLMGDFFTFFKESGSPPHALRKAQLKQIEKRRELYGAAHPYYWAAFTVTGQ